ncbi:MAG: acyl-CoA desaturase [Pseudomonadales bacterium]
MKTDAQPQQGQDTEASVESKPPLLWVQTILFVATFAIAVIGVPWYQLSVGFHWSAIVGFVLFCGFSGISITAGYHRLWAHNAYKARAPLRLFFALFGAATVQNSIYTWVAGHRRHHRHVDDDHLDPYSAGRGLWFSHMGWMLREYPSGHEDYNNVADLKRDKVVMWQHNHYLPITLATNFAPPLLVGWLTGDYLANLLLMGVARLVFTHHTTFFINSLAHFWGKRPYTEGNSARDNGVLALFTYGEGYHNYHHKFQRDYRNGVKWWQFDPTKWLISASSWVGLASDLQRVEAFRIREAEVETQLRRAEKTLEVLPNADKWRSVLEEETQHFVQCLEECLELRNQLVARQRAVLDATTAGFRKRVKDPVQAQLLLLEQALKEQVNRLSQLNLQMAPG